MRRLTLLKIATWLLCLGPAAFLGWRTYVGHLGPNPVETLEHETGLRALQMLLFTLAMSPLRQFAGWAEPVQLRRTLGLFAYFYACVHFSIYLVFDLQFSAVQLADDLIKRTYITLGFTAWLLLLPLAVTSTSGWQRRLKRRWKQLHRLIYPAVLLGALHFVWLVKKDERTPLSYLAVLLALLALRLPWARWMRAMSSRINGAKNDAPRVERSHRSSMAD
jgi:sulfoxide reductase heme-binding subunit YedZ